MPIPAITMADLADHDRRSARSRSADPGDHDAPICAITLARRAQLAEAEGALDVEVEPARPDLR
jgi:hypothetical protein